MIIYTQYASDVVSKAIEAVGDDSRTLAESNEVIVSLVSVASHLIGIIDGLQIVETCDDTTIDCRRG